MSRRLNVNINDETAVALQRLAEKQGTSVTEIVRRAVGTYNFIDRELGDKDAKTSLQIVDEKTNERTKLAVLR